MLPTDMPDHRRSGTRALLGAIAQADSMALAEAYHRSSAAAHACASRLLHDRAEIEGVLRAVYLALWEDPPADAPLEAWVRHRVFVEARAHLQEAGRGAASPSASLLLRDAPMTDAALDRTERLIADLDDDALRALLLAHDRGIPTADQRSEGAGEALRRALLGLAEADEPGTCPVPGLADWVLGLLGDEDGARIAAQVSDSPECTETVRTLRRGRRRIEGLPVPPDLGHRVVAYVLARASMPMSGAPTEHPPAAATPAQPASDEHVPPVVAEKPASPAPEGPHEEEPLSAPAPADPAPSALGGDVEDADASAPAEDVDAPSALDELLADLPPGPEPAPDAADHREEPADEQPGWGGGSQAVAEPPPPGGAASDEAEREPAPPTAAPPAGEPVAAVPDRPARGGLPDDESLHFEEFGAEVEEPGRGRRALTVTFTVLGALLLLAAGGVAGLLLIRVLLG